MSSKSVFTIIAIGVITFIALFMFLAEPRTDVFPSFNAASNATPHSPRPAVAAATAPTPLRADGPILIRRGARISILSAIDEAVAQRLTIPPSNYLGLANFVVRPIARRREPAGLNAFLVGIGPIESEGADVLMTLTLAPGRDGASHRLTLSAIQGRNIWARTIERGPGRERPGLERMLGGEEQGIMPLSERLAASVPVDIEDLGKEFVEHATWELGR
jgi:hypothetical protein